MAIHRTNGDYKIKYDGGDDNQGNWTLTHYDTGEVIVVSNYAAYRLTSAVINRELRLQAKFKATEEVDK